MKKEFTVIIERDEDGYFIGTVPALKGCHTQAKSLDELLERMKEAVLLCLEVEGNLFSSGLASLMMGFGAPQPILRVLNEIIAWKGNTRALEVGSSKHPDSFPERLW